jgi:SRSO17 transposase
LNCAGPDKQAAWVIRGRTITPTDVKAVQELLLEKPGLGRWGLALELCQRWQWQATNGDWKGRSALAVLVELARRGWIELPASVRSAAASRVRSPRAERWAGEVINGSLARHRPLRWQLVDTVEQRQQWRHLLEAYHYLGAPGLVGANLKYLVYDRDGQILGALGWQSAVAYLGCRDRSLQWSPGQRARYLDRLVNNVRFLMLPWVRVRHLASVILSEGVRQLQRDWPQHYGVPVWWVESFVDRQRFTGASYRAANWQAIGWTRGFAKRPEGFVHHGQKKEVYVYVIEPRMRQIIHQDDRQPLLTRAFLLAQRIKEENQLTKRARMKHILESWKPKLPPQCELSVEEVEKVGQELSQFTALFHDAFGRVEPTQLFELHLQGLLSEAERKNMEAIALRLGGPDRVRNLQRFMSEYQWDEASMRKRHWQVAAESLNDEQGVWSIDASEFPKKGHASVGVAAQYCGALGKTANCQSGVFICYSSPKGHALLDSRLYLPKGWFEPEFEERRKQCRIPEKTTFKTKQELALELLKPLLETNQFGGKWITCDCSFGNNEPFLEGLPQDFYYLAEIACTRKVWIKKTGIPEKLKTAGCTVEQLLKVKHLLNWQTHKISEGEKGPIVAAFARVRVYLSAERTPESERWLLLRNDANRKIKYALSNAPEEIPMKELVRVSGARWPIERCFQEDKSELGLDHYEHRSWTAWHRHMRLVFLAQLFLLRLQIKFKKNACVDPASSTPAPGVQFSATQTPTRLPSDPGGLPYSAQRSSLSLSPQTPPQRTEKMEIS